ncbi:calcium-binding protein [Neorhizobium alkalisoli]|uniref:Hemolysin type calcium-binding protein n=1 Tax=Neorhizobium alkalisoli TaxID=528178 RepID=A0A561R3M5_9HYPH|nr:calcium-binding protein [Neorhizobium alkalisoli]TWF57191.1 hemolysin type calcium-binding protein [Neorhizobium alkalisoli]
MAIHINAYDPDSNGISIYFDQYLTHKFDSFDNVAGTFSTDAGVTEYAFIGADGGGIVFHSSTGWTVDSTTGDVIGTLDSISFGQQTSTALDGTFIQTAEMTMSGLDVSSTDLQKIFDEASGGSFYNLYQAMRPDDFVVFGSSSKDSLVGGDGHDIIHGGAGDDRIYGRGNFGVGDRLVGGDGNDKIIGGRGADVIYGGNGDDVISSKGGQDIVRGGAGNDIIDGGGNLDKLYGDSGDDTIYGGRYEDRLYGGTGNDTLYGGSSPDTFVFEKDAGNDIIADFKPGKAGKDVILFHDVDLKSFADVLDHAADTAGGLLITYDEGTLLLENVKLAQLDKHDFLFS